MTRQRTTPDPRARSLPFRGFFKRVLSQHIEMTDALLASLDQHYTDAYARRPVVENVMLRFHMNYAILPGLAIYRALQQEAGLPRARAIAITEDAIIRITRRSGRWMYPIYKYLPFAFFRWVTRSQLRYIFPAPGFTFTWAANDSGKIAFHMQRCFYLGVLKAYDAPELTTVYCEADKVMGEYLAPVITFERETTIARGDEACDFCFRHEPRSAR